MGRNPEFKLLAVPVENAVLHPGDRVALVPPGVPGPHRVLLGLHGIENEDGHAPDPAPAKTGGKR